MTTTYLEGPHAFYHHSQCPPSYLEDARTCRTFHVLGRSQPPAPPPPPPRPTAPLLQPHPPYLPTPPNHYTTSHHRQEPGAPQVSRPYMPYHVAQTPSPRTSQPFYFVGTWSKDKFIDMTAYMLDTAAELNNDFVALPNYTQTESVYFSVSRPDIPTKDYIRRLVTYTRCSPAAFVVMLIYIDRIATVNRLLLVTPYNMHRLLVTALTLASKYLDDRCYSNLHYAKVGGIPTAREMNRLELQYLKYLDYRLHVRFEDYKKKLTSLMDVTPPSSPTSVMYHTSPVTTACTSPTSVSPMERAPLPVERTLDFEGRYGLGRMVDENPAVEVTIESSYPKSDPYAAQHHQAMQQRITQDKWFQWNNSPTRPAMQRTKPKRSSRRDAKLASSHDPRFYHASHPSAMPVRYAECAP